MTQIITLYPKIQRRSLPRRIFYINRALDRAQCPEFRKMWERKKQNLLKKYSEHG